MMVLIFPAKNVTVHAKLAKKMLKIVQIAIMGNTHGIMVVEIVQMIVNFVLIMMVLMV